MTDMSPETSRRARRSLVASLFTTALLGPVALAPAAVVAAPASSYWTDTDNPSLMSALLLLVGGAALLYAVIFLLSYLPSMIRGQRGASAESWHDEPEWFGGPRKGTAAVDSASGAEPDTTHEGGGASARW
jgi:hypothetical protein